MRCYAQLDASMELRIIPLVYQCGNQVRAGGTKTDSPLCLWFLPWRLRCADEPNPMGEKDVSVSSELTVPGARQ